MIKASVDYEHGQNRSVVGICEREQHGSELAVANLNLMLALRREPAAIEAFRSNNDFLSLLCRPVQVFIYALFGQPTNNGG